MKHIAAKGNVPAGTGLDWEYIDWVTVFTRAYLVTLDWSTALRPVDGNNAG